MNRFLATLLVALALLSPAQAAPDIQELIKTFEPYAEKSRQEWGTPGLAVAIVADDKVVYARGFGVREVGGQDPVTAETIFQIGSISKSFTSALVGQLVDEKLVAWTDRVVDSVPGFQMHDSWVTREFTVEDLMSQRSGMEPYAGDILAFMGRSREQIVEAIRHIKPITSARTQFAYVNNLWLVAAQVIEAKTGQSWEDNVRQRLFTPLGMTSTTTGFEEFYGAPNHATPHMRGASGLTPQPRNWPFARWVYIYGPAGGINSNVLDMARYARMQLRGAVDGKNLISKTTLDHLHSPHILVGGTTNFPSKGIAETGTFSYCLGWLRQQTLPQPIVWHNGGTSGSKAVIGLIPDSDVAIIALSNFADTELPEALMYKFYDLYLGRPEQDYSANFLKAHMANLPKRPNRPSPAAPPQQLANYAGSYRNDVYGEVVVRVEGDGLRANLGPVITMRFQPWNRDTFLFDNFMNPADEPQFATFLSDNAGKVEALKIDALYSSPGGLFTRTATAQANGPGKLP
jgi:CubicO group peptidase (beta-lactamase class C family)